MRRALRPPGGQSLPHVPREQHGLAGAAATAPSRAAAARHRARTAARGRVDNEPGPESGSHQEDKSRRRTASEIALAAVVVYAVVFLLLNTGRVKVHFVVWTATMALSWVIFLSLMLGLVAGLLVMPLRARRRRRRR